MGLSPGTLPRIFFGAAIGVSALTVHLMTGPISQYFADKHEPVRLNQDGEKLSSVFSPMRAGGSAEEPGSDIDRQKQSPTTAPAVVSPDDVDPEIEWMDVHDMSDPKIRMYLAKRAYRDFMSEQSSHKKYEILSDMIMIIPDEGDWQKFTKETGFTKQQYYKALGEYSAKAIDDFKKMLEATPQGDLVTRANILTRMRDAYEYVGTTDDGMVWTGGVEGESARKAITGLVYEDMETPLKAIAQGAAEQGYAVIMAYSQTAPHDKTTWERYDQSYLAIAEYLAYAKPEEKTHLLNQIGLTEDLWEQIEGRDRVLRRQEHIRYLEERGIKKPIGNNQSSLASATGAFTPS